MNQTRVVDFYGDSGKRWYAVEESSDGGQTFSVCPMLCEYGGRRGADSAARAARSLARRNGGTFLGVVRK